jgi:hypothetical protein
VEAVFSPNAILTLLLPELVNSYLPFPGFKFLFLPSEGCDVLGITSPGPVKEKLTTDGRDT